MANTILGSAVTNAEMTVSVDHTNRRVTVDLTRSAPTFFARVFGINSADVHVQAIAEAAPDAGCVKCPKPWFVPSTILSGRQNPCAVCNTRSLIDSSGRVTDFGKSMIGTSFPVGIIGAQDNLSSGGKVFGISFPNDTQNPSDPQYQNNISQCQSGVTNACNQPTLVKDATMAQLTPLTTNGLTSLINGPNGDLTPDRYQALGQYGPQGGPYSDTSRQLITVPIFDPCTDPNFSCSKGGVLLNRSQGLKPIGFARVFADLQAGNVVFYLVGLSGCNLSIDYTMQPMGAYGVPVRLVR
jgi:hypothetical protein